MDVLFGVKMTGLDIDQVGAEIAKFISAVPTARVNDYNGPYVAFGDFVGERIRLIGGKCSDEDGDYPAETDFPDWKYLLYLSRTNADSAWLKSLTSDASRFEKLRVE